MNGPTAARFGQDGSVLSSLPAKTSPSKVMPMNETSPASATTGASKARVREVLVVDDLPEIGDFFKALMRRLREFDIHLTTEVNSQRALEMVREKPFDLVVSDFRMRQVDGVEVLKAAHDRHPRGLRILMTGYNEIPTSVERIRLAHVDAYIQKPLKSQDLLLLILDFLNGNQDSIDTHRRYAREMEDLGAKEEAQGATTLVQPPPPATPPGPQDPKATRPGANGSPSSLPRPMTADVARTLLP